MAGGWGWRVERRHYLDVGTRRLAVATCALCGAGDGPLYIRRYSLGTETGSWQPKNEKGEGKSFFILVFAPYSASANINGAKTQHGPCTLLGEFLLVESSPHSLLDGMVDVVFVWKPRNPWLPHWCPVDERMQFYRATLA